jgi:hypothetical protein
VDLQTVVVIPKIPPNGAHGPERDEDFFKQIANQTAGLRNREDVAAVEYVAEGLPFYPLLEEIVPPPVFAREIDLLDEG